MAGLLAARRTAPHPGRARQQSATTPQSASAGLSRLQRSIGNRGRQRFVSPQIQRKLMVGGPPDPTDAAASITPDVRTNMARQLVDELSPGFTEKQLGTGEPNGEVVPTGADCSRAESVSGGKNPLGCCCPCLL